jgi:hypothetical protein
MSNPNRLTFDILNRLSGMFDSNLLQETWSIFILH